MRPPCFLFGGLVVLAALASATYSENVLPLTLEDMGAEPADDVDAVLRVSWRTPAERELLRKLVGDADIDVWRASSAHADILASTQHREAIARSGLPYAVQVPDVQALIQETDSGAAAAKADFSSGYHDVDDIHQRMEALAAKHSDRAQTVDLGTSVEGKAVKALQINGDKPGAAEIIILGGQHAREWIAPAALLHAASQLLEEQAELGESAQPLRRAIDSFKITLVPLMNPDGYQYSREQGNRMWRKNAEGEEEWRKNLGEGQQGSPCFGVDLNRNWQGTKEFSGRIDLDQEATEKCSNGFEGPHPFSEPETRAVRDYIQQRTAELGDSSDPGVVGFVDVHSYGEDLIMPGCDERKMTPSAKRKIDDMATAMAKGINSAHQQKYVTGTCQSLLGYEFTGGAADWAHFDAKVPYAISIETRSRDHGYGFISPKADIKPAGEEILSGIGAMAESIQGQEGR